MYIHSHLCSSAAYVEYVMIFMLPTALYIVIFVGLYACLKSIDIKFEHNIRALSYSFSFVFYSMVYKIRCRL